MNPTTDFQNKRAELQAQMQQIEQQEKEQQQQARQQLERQLAEFENEAKNYRSEAGKAQTDEDKMNCFRYAGYYDDQAKQVRQQLGLAVPETPEQLTPEQEQDSRILIIKRRVNSLLLKALCGLVLFVLSDFIAGEMKSGFFSFALTVGAQLTWFVTVACALCWLSTSILLSVIGRHVDSVLIAFRRSNDATKLYMVVALLAVLLVSLSNLFPNAK